MNDPTPNEERAIKLAGEAAGEYLDEIEKTDLAALSDDEWKTFLTCVVDVYSQYLREMTALDAQRVSDLDPLP